MAEPRQPDRLSFGEWIARLGAGALGPKGWAVIAIVTLLLIALVGYLIGHG
jgi:hypothetical protein